MRTLNAAMWPWALRLGGSTDLGTRGGTPDEVAEAEVLITILPGCQELHDVMIIPRSA